MRRPYGICVVDVSKTAITKLLPWGKELQSNNRIFVPANEKDFTTFHETIISSTAGLTEAKNSSGLACSLQLYPGRMPVESSQRIVVDKIRCVVFVFVFVEFVVCVHSCVRSAFHRFRVSSPICRQLTRFVYTRI